MGASLLTCLRGSIRNSTLTERREFAFTPVLQKALCKYMVMVILLLCLSPGLDDARNAARLVWGMICIYTDVKIYR